MKRKHKEPTCNVTGHSDCRGCIYGYYPESWDGGCMIPDEYRTREKAALFMKDHFDLLDEMHERFKKRLSAQAERCRR